MSDRFDLMSLAVQLVAQNVQPISNKERLEAAIDAYKKIFETIEKYSHESD